MVMKLMIKKNTVRIEGTVNGKMRSVLLKDMDSLRCFFGELTHLMYEYCDSKNISKSICENRMEEYRASLKSKKYSEFKLQPEWFAWIKAQFTKDGYEQNINNKGQYYYWSIKHQANEV